MKKYNIPVFVPHRGCPHDCVFCNQRHITGEIRDAEPSDVKRIIDKHLPTIKDNSYVEVAFFGGSFTGIDINQQTRLLKAVDGYIKDGKVHGIRCSTRPDYINDEILSNLLKYNTKCIELGVQSTDAEVLKSSNRGHTFEDVINSSKLIKSYGIELGLQMMLGLPGDTFSKMIKTCEDLISLSPSCVRIYPTLIVKDTGLYSMYERGEYTPLAVDEATEILSVIIPKFINAGIDVIRVGLQTTDEINEDTVTGPYHPAIRELAESRIIRKTIISSLDKNTALAEIKCHPSRVSQVVGHKRENTKYFQDEHQIKLIVKADKNTPVNELRINGKMVNIY